MNLNQALQLRGEAQSYERQEAIWLLEHILSVNSFELRLNMMQDLTQAQEQLYLDGLMRLSKGEPLAYITGSQPFWNLDLLVSSDTLVPRPDTEILIETVLGLNLPYQSVMLDLGTGSGAIALALAKERPDWQVIATDIYGPTLEIARKNAIKHGLEQVKFQQSQWFDQLSAQKFDLIVSNPPYIDEEDPHLEALTAEPYRALVAKKAGLADLENIIFNAPDWLKSNGWLVLEHGYTQGQSVRELLKSVQFGQVLTIKDYAGNDRISLGKYQEM